MLLNVISVIPVLIWIYLLFFRGGFWQISKTFARPLSAGVPDKRVVAVIPARNEADVIARSLRSLFQQQFPSPIHIFLVDDNSTDDTAGVAAQTAEREGRSLSLTVSRGQPLERGWTGKLWALAQGISEAEKLAPDYLLLTDADVVHGPNTAQELVAIAEECQLDLTSYMVKLACTTLAEEALIPAFLFFFLKLYPPRWIASSKHKTAGAAGGCMLVRPDALRRIGGLASIKNEVIDDCALARAIKATGGRVWMGLTAMVYSARSYSTFQEIGRMVSRTAFNQLGHSIFMLAVALAGLLVTYLLPPLLLITGEPRLMAPGVLAWTIMTIAYLPTSRFYTRSIVWSLSLPLVACFYIGATMHSAIRYWSGLGGEWKGRIQDARS